MAPTRSGDLHALQDSLSAPLSPLLERILASARHLRQQRTLGYLIAIVLFGCALMARFALNPHLSAGFPFLTFFPAIVITAFIGGLRPGILCSVLSVLAAWFFFIPPFFSFKLDYQSSLAVAFFALISVVDLVVIDLVIRSLERLEQTDRQTKLLLEQRNTLFQEMQHRVANNMSMMAVVLAASEKRLAHNPEAVQAIADARQRFSVLSAIHRRLHDPKHQEQSIGEFLPGLCRQHLDALGCQQVVVELNAQPLPLSLEQKTTLSLLILELITNAAKHAFDPGQPGLIRIELAQDGPAQALLTIQDNGRGIPDGVDATASKRLGMRIMNGLAKSLGGTLKVENRLAESGTIAQLRFTLASPHVN